MDNNGITHEALHAIAMISVEGERVEFVEPLLCHGAVEVWLNQLIQVVYRSLHALLVHANKDFPILKREELIMKYCAQIGVLACEIGWNYEVLQALQHIDDGNDLALKNYNLAQQERLESLINLIRGNLDNNDLAKVTTLVTVDVHARDVVNELVDAKVDSPSSFMWQRQLRLSVEAGTGNAIGTCCNASFPYYYEYLGNGGRLVITPLTDRCYITLTTALKLCMGGAPAGPAGTGKTETVKDLGKALAKYVYVFNASEQMDHISLGQLWKGTAQSGAWSCFDEMNRVTVDVLSVVSTQLRVIFNAIRAGDSSAIFEGERIKIDKAAAVFITMNPGYAGRTELPQSLKSLFRSVSMITPDLVLIAENMLLSQGFSTARVLAKKCVTLYRLSADLISKQAHYDWGLRSLKSVLMAAGAAKRKAAAAQLDDPSMPIMTEEVLMMRTLHDFTISKIG